MIWRRCALILAIALILGALFAPATLRPWVTEIDHLLGGELLKDTWGLVRWNERWQSAHSLPAEKLDDGWLEVARQTGEIRIAHALGAATTPTANTIGAMRTSRTQGFRFFEVDLWLDEGGRVRCFHGDDVGTIPAPFRTGDCTFDDVMKELDGNSWLILDIKSDFKRTGLEVIRRAAVSCTMGRRLIFQLYHPSDVDTFSTWANKVCLSTPIVTTYAAHRSVAHIESQFRRLNVQAFAVPLAMLDQLVPTNSKILLMTYPVHDCDALMRSRRAGVRAFYTVSSLRC